MTGAKVILLGDVNAKTGVRVSLDTGTVPLPDPDSTCTITFGPVFDSSAKPKKQEDDDWEKQEKERERTKKMREGWKDIRKGHEWRK